MYLYDFLASRTAGPSQGDLIDALLGAEIDGRKVEIEDALPVLFLLVGGGLETTSSALSNALFYLANNPEDRTRLIEDPAMLPTAVEEFIRYSGSLHGMQRVLEENAEFCGRTLRKGDRILLNYASANRDPNEFDQADRCVIDRTPNRHIGFGIGVHRCIGSNVARLNLRVALEEIFRRMPDYALDANRPAHLHGAIARNFTSLPVTFTPGSVELSAGSSAG